MYYVSLPDNRLQRLSFYLAMEEYVAHHLETLLPEEKGASPGSVPLPLGQDAAWAGGGLREAFFLWQVEPSVIFGRNQVMENEVDIDFCRAHGIQTYRRKSGGGCVYADRGNVMFSYITRSTEVNFTFHRFISMLMLVLRRLGLEATASERNDVMVNGRKVSGTAYYRLPKASIVHGTMLYDTTMSNMAGALTPPREKLQRHGVESVPQRIGLLKDYISLSQEEFIAFARQTLCNRELRLTASDMEAIGRLEQEYLSDDFIHLK
ncbi:MAG: lipoate--protein ligase family protein [Bacteroidaceae bacterium]|nr:lipoate--protein ligase family protein [Bacteroidaceae bacterium]